MKKILTSIALAAAATTMATASIANCNSCNTCVTSCCPTLPAPTCSSLMSGWYFGGQFAYDSYRIRQSITIPPLFADEIFSATAIRNAVGVAGGLFAGYGMTLCGPLYLGGEVWANASNAGASTNSIIFAPDFDSVSSDVKGKWSWGVSILPGYKLNCSTLLYTRLGYARHQLKTSATLTLDASSFSVSNTDWFSGFQYGLGLETAICGPWSIRTEYNHTFLGSNSSRSRVPGGSVNWSASDNQYSLGVVYHFC